MCPWQVSLYRSCHVVSHSITYVCVCVCVQSIAVDFVNSVVQDSG